MGDPASSPSPPFGERLAPALTLVLLAPVVAEFLLADFTVRQLGILVALAPLYGCGALLIREITRRTHRGWPTIVLFALAYALLEEAFLTQSLFNPNYVGQRLLDYGFIPSLGTSLNWTSFVLSIHIVWSVATPILIAEGLAGERRTTPWLKQPGLIVATVLFLLGCAATAAFSLKSSPFVASAIQFLVSAMLIAGVIVVAFTAFREPWQRSTAKAAPSRWLVCLVMVVLASVYFAGESVARERGMPPVAPLVFRLACEATATWLLVTWSTRRGWDARHYIAVASGTTLTYFLFGLNALMRGHTNLGAPTNAVDVGGHIALSVTVLALIVQGVRANRRQERTESLVTAS